MHNIAAEAKTAEKNGKVGCRSLVMATGSSDSFDNEEEDACKDSMRDDDEPCASPNDAAGFRWKGCLATRTGGYPGSPECGVLG